MEANEAAFAFMKGSIRIEIPFFQRGYVWNQDNWKDLIEDLLDTSSSHFLGSIILKSIRTQSGDIPRWSLIDGQQRLTTLSILLRACYDTLPIDTYDQETQDDLRRDINDMLFFKYKSISSKRDSKIKHSMVDSLAFNKVISGEVANELNCTSLTSKEEPNPHSIIQCYKYFRSALAADKDKAVELWELLLNENAKIIVKIDLDTDENEQAIFDTVNSSGVRLTCADTIKNSLFQHAIEKADVIGLTREKVISFYKETWETAFSSNSESITYWATLRPLGRITRDNLEILLHCVALIRGFYNPESNKISDLPQVYKDYIKNLSSDDLLSFIQEICNYASIYKTFFFTFNETTLFSYNRPIQRLFHVLDKCDVSTFHAYILKLLSEHSVQDEDSISVDLEEELKNIERIAMRYVTCKVSTKNFNKNCVDFISGKIKPADMLADKNEAISDDVMRHQLRNIGNRQATLILFWVELKRRAEDVKCAEKELKYCYSLEHIMPQKWQQYWPVTNPQVVEPTTGQAVSNDDEAANIRGNAVYEIGNMALLNSSLNTSIRNYELKRKIEGEGKKAGIRTYDYLLYTKDVVTTAESTGAWNEQNIFERTKIISNEALKIW